MTKSILGYDVEAGTLSECIKEIDRVLARGGRNGRWLACLNPHTYAAARNDKSISDALRAADWLVPDGTGIVMAGRILGQTLNGRITGFDIFDGVMKVLDQRGGRVFFLGSTDETLGIIEKKLPGDYANVVLAGTYSPPFKAEFEPEDVENMLAAIIEADADVLWVGMTAPKQEKWIAMNHDQLPVVFAGAIGAVFDFYSGQIKRSHPVFQKTGLEWLPRLLKQPQRLWRRMAISAPVFLWDVLLARLSVTREKSI